LKNESVCCSKCTGIPNNISITKKKKIRKKNNWNIKEIQKERNSNSVINFGDDINMISIPSLIFLSENHKQFCIFKNSIGNETLHSGK
jgi:hypothetical protein